MGLNPASNRPTLSLSRDGPSAGLLGLATRSNQLLVPMVISSSQCHPINAQDDDEGLNPFMSPNRAASLSMKWRTARWYIRLPQTSLAPMAGRISACPTNGSPAMDAGARSKHEAAAT